MQLHQLEYFVAVAEERSVTRAAERLRVAQPGVSAQVRKLERELSQPLLDRSGPAIALTEVGAAVLDAARDVLSSVAGVRRVVDDLTSLVRGHVAIGAVTSGPFLDIPDVLAGFQARYPDVGVSLTAGGSRELLAQLRAGRLDVALVGVTGPDPPGLHVETVTEESLVAAVAADDPLATRTSVTLAELGERVLVAPAEGDALRDAGEDAFAAAGLAPHVALEASDPAVVARMVGRGLGVAVLPDSLHAFRTTDVAAVPLAVAVPRARLALVWRSDAPRSPAARVLTERMIEELE